MRWEIGLKGVMAAAESRRAMAWIVGLAPAAAAVVCELLAAGEDAIGRL
jgi:hypothetical protein